MHVVIVDGDVPYPPTSGKRLRTLNLMLPLAKRHRLTYLARGDANGAETRRAVEFLADHGVRTVVVDHPVARKAGPLFYARLAANLLSPLPYSVASHVSPRLRAAVTEFAARNRADLWQFEWSAYVSSLSSFPDARTVLVAPNVDSLIWQRYHETERQPLKRWYVKRQWRKFERFERRAFHRVTRVVAVSDDDAALMRERFGVGHVDVVENGVDLAFFGQVEPRRDPRRLLFLGALDWRPNLDAVTLLLHEILPPVVKEEPGAKLLVVGRSPPAWLRQRVREVPAAELHADVADVRPYLGTCGVLTVPLRVGGGSRLKILEALASGLPVVATRVGAEGLRLVPGRDLALADSAPEMARALVDSIRAPGRYQEMAEHGRRVVRERYGWAGLAAKLESVWERCVAHQTEAPATKKITSLALQSGE